MVLGIILSILAPILASTRWRGIEIRCLGNMRQAGLLLTTYATSNKDYLPYQGTTPRLMHVTGLPPIVMGHPTANSMSSGRWSVFFPDSWGAGGRWDASLRCPLQPKFNRESPDCTGALCWEKERPFPCYELSNALFYRADSMGPERNGDQFEIGPNRLSDAVYPSSKVLLFEFPAFCLQDRAAREYAWNTGKCFNSKASTLTIDGACRRFAARDAVDYPERGEAYYTVFGIQGRDLP